MIDNNSNYEQNRRSLLKSVAAVGAIGPFVNTAAASTGGENTVNYEGLSSSAKQLFMQELNSEVSEEFAYAQFPPQLLEYDFVNYEGSTYDLKRTYRSKARYKIAPEKFSKNQLTNGDEKDVIDAKHMSNKAKSVLLNALSEGNYKTTGDFPEQFKFHYQYVTYEGELFDLNFDHADEPFFRITPEKVE